MKSKQESALPGNTPFRSWLSVSEYESLLLRMVVDYAPPVFAVIQHLGLREDARIAAWGVVVGDGVCVVPIDDPGHPLTAPTPPLAAYLFRCPERNITASVEWVTRGSTLDSFSGDM